VLGFDLFRTEIIPVFSGGDISVRYTGILGFCGSLEDGKVGN
jgi:hypothetical protein